MINSQRKVLKALKFYLLTLLTPSSIYAIFATYFLRPGCVILLNFSSQFFGTWILSFKGLNLLQPVCGDWYARYINKGSLWLWAAILSSALAVNKSVLYVPFLHKSG